MNDETISALHDFTLEARELLEKEVGEQLEGIYGLLPNGRLEPSEKYPALKELPEAKETRTRIEQFLEDEKAAGVNTKQARDKLAKEAAFTWLNRLVAFNMMESRGLLRQTVSKGPQSRAFLLWLTGPKNETDYEKYEQGDLPQNALGEGPRQAAYRHFLLWQCGQLSQEIRVLFDPDNLASHLFPRPLTLSKLINKMNVPDLEEAWAPGNEETIGWVYQYYNEPDLEIFRGNSRLKVPPHLVGPRTQQFTPRWVVKFLVHNTIGRLWVEMHPDSSIVEILDYLVPFDNKTSREFKPVSEITVLDPACGTMHFGLVAFDLFSFMYKEEIERAGEPDWPEKPSINTEKEIASAILANNIFGIDIDLRSVQLSALTLLLKAKMLNPKVEILETNLTCADVVLLNSDKLEIFLKEMAFGRPIYGRLIKATWKILKNANEFGSLLRPETEIQELIEEEKRQLKKDLPMFPDKERYADAYSGDEDFWLVLDAQIVQAFDEFARQHGDQDHGMRFFSNEAIKGFKLLNMMNQRFDVVMTNPPYLDNRDYNTSLKAFLNSSYPLSKRNLYSACTERFLEFLNNNGRLGIITGQSFMFISSFERVRKNCLTNNLIECLIQFDYGLFSARVDTSAHVLRREPDAITREEANGTYFRLVKEPNSESKQRRFEEALGRLKSGKEDQIVYRYRQGDFDAIPGSPWVYWITPGLRRLFVTLPKLGEIAPSRQGLATADNFRFLRYWWEIGKPNIGYDCLSREECENRREKWYPYMKGGSFLRWYGNQEICINYGRNGYELKAWADPLYNNSGWSRIIKSTDFYFRRGVTYSYLTSGSFSARLSPGGFIFDVAGSSVFPSNISLVLAIMNSTFATYALKLINPTVNFQVGDLARLPTPKTSSTTLNALVDQVINLAKSNSTEDETTYDFIIPPDWRSGIEDLQEMAKRLADIEREIDEEVYRLYDISDEDRKAIEEELAEGGVADADSEDAINELRPETERSDDLAKQWISYAVGIVMGRFEPGMEKALGRGRFPAEAAAQLRTLADPDGILVMDEGHTDDLPAKVVEAMTIMLGDEAATEVVRAATGKEGPAEELLRQYLERTFFKLHIQQYHKRPVYWFLQSPKKKYGVWLFHERMNKDTLFRIRTEYVDYKINLLEGHIAELREKRDAAEGREKRKLEKEIGALSDVLDDIREFSKRLEYIIEERGYVPHIDDGVLLNMAPLWELIPSWQKEPKNASEALERGDYDWSYQAMDHWPERVREKCKTNRSYAIAHGLE